MVKKRKLVHKFILGFALTGIIISIISIVAGIHGFREAIQKQYNTTAYDVAETVETYIGKEELYAYAVMLNQIKETGDADACGDVTESVRYQEIQQQMEHLRSSMGANDIFIAMVDMDQLVQEDVEQEDWTPLYYMFDTYQEKEQSYHFGNVGPFNPKYRNSIREQLKTCSRASDYYISRSKFGYNTSAVLPIRLSDPDLPVLICVEIPMSTLQSAVRDLSYHTLGTIIAAMVVIILLFVYYLYHTVIHPINIIAAETEAFGDSGTQLSERLLTVKTRDELQGLAESVLKMEQGILDYVKDITTVTAEKERISTELNVATDIQANMLPRIFPAFPERKEFDIYASMTPAKEVGGDFYDFFLVDEEHLAMVVGDVSGKGVPAALYMVIAKTLLKNQAGSCQSPGEILQTVNEQLCENNESEMFVTVWMGIMEISTGRIVAANAGHEFPAVRKRNGEFTLLKDRHGFVLGGIEGSQYQEYEFVIREGEGLFIYTDGVPEATNAEQELFGTERMLNALNETLQEKPQQIVRQVKDAIAGFVGQAPQFDDTTMLVLVRNPAASSAL